MRFVTIDLETANSDMASICAAGIAIFEDGHVSSEWYSLINPFDYFDPINISIHGIDEQMVSGSPSFADVSQEINEILNGNTVATHNHFDRVALHQAARHWEVNPPSCIWIDTARIARRTWLEFAHRGYGLANVCKRIGYEFQHHNALEDAKAAGQVLTAAMAVTGLDIDGILKRLRQPIDPRARESIKRAGNPDGPLFGEVIVFTGALEIPRREAANMASVAWCEVAQSVMQATTILVVGDNDIRKLAGHEKSSKHRKADELIAKGYPIRIIRETDFRAIAEFARTN